jgi:hypothetical protein
MAQEQEHFLYLSLFLRCTVWEEQGRVFLDIPCLAYEIGNLINFQCFLSTMKIFLITIFLRRDVWEKKGVTFVWKNALPVQKTCTEIFKFIVTGG